MVGLRLRRRHCASRAELQAPTRIGRPPLPRRVRCWTRCPKPYEATSGSFGSPSGFAGPGGAYVAHDVGGLIDPHGCLDVTPLYASFSRPTILILLPRRAPVAQSLTCPSLSECRTPPLTASTSALAANTGWERRLARARSVRGASFHTPGRF